MSQLEGPGKDDRFIMLGHAHDSPGAVVGKPSQDSGAQSSPKGISEVSTRAGLAHMQLRYERTTQQIQAHWSACTKSLSDSALTG